MYKLGAAGIPERAQSLIVIIVGWGDSCDHDGFGITPQRILQQAGQFGISVGYVMGFAIDQRRDYVAQRA